MNKKLIINTVAAIVSLLLSIFLCPFIAALFSDRPFTIAIVWAVIILSYSILRCIVPIIMGQEIPHNIRDSFYALLSILKKLFTTKYLIILLIWGASACSTLSHIYGYYGWIRYQYGYMVHGHVIYDKWGFEMSECCGHDEYYMGILPSGEQLLIGVDNIHIPLYDGDVYCEDLCFTYYDISGEIKEVIHTNNNLTFKSIDETNKTLREFLKSYSDVTLFFHLSKSKRI